MLLRGASTVGEVLDFFLIGPADRSYGGAVPGEGCEQHSQPAFVSSWSPAPTPPTPFWLLYHFQGGAWPPRTVQIPAALCRLCL